MSESIREEYDEEVIQALEEEVEGDSFNTFEVRIALNALFTGWNEREVNGVLKELEEDGYIECEADYSEESMFSGVKEKKNYEWFKTENYSELFD